MIDDVRLRRLLRSALPPIAGRKPSRDLWPQVVNRLRAPVGWVWFDISLAAVVTILLLIFPEWLALLVYHL